MSAGDYAGQDMLTKEQMLTLLGTLATVSATGIGLAVGGTVGATVMAGLGLNLGSNIIQGGASNLKERWLTGGDGLLNHDIQKALARAFAKALTSLEARYFASSEAAGLRPHERESVRELFGELKEHAQETLLVSVGRMPLDPVVRHHLFNAPGGDTRELWDHLVGDDLLSTYGPDFGGFVRRHLLDETLVWFAEELKADNSGSNRAWRAFQRMLLEGIYADVQSVRAGQAEIAHDLREIDARRARLEQLDEVFRRGLEEAAGEIRASLRDIGETNRRIDENVRGLRADLSRFAPMPFAPPPSREELEKELMEIRREMLGGSGSALRGALYRTEEFLGRHPHHAEASQLRDDIRRAINFESMPYAHATARPPAETAPPPQRGKGAGWVVPAALGLLLLLALYALVRWLA